MSLLDSNLGDRWARVSDFYDVTRKPRDIDRLSLSAIPFAAMDAIPQGGAYAPAFTMKSPTEIASGTYFERGDILVAKITPSFENGKQALVMDLPTSFGYATTEVIPLHVLDDHHDPRLLFFYLLHPDIRQYLADRMEGSTGRQRIPEDVLLELPFPRFQRDDEVSISNALEVIQCSAAAEQACETNLQQLKGAAMQTLFTRGLRAEPQKDTEIGPMPESWRPRTILDLCEIWSGGTPRKSVAEYWNGEIPWVSGKDLKAPTLNDAIDHVTADGVNAGSRIAPVGAVLVLVRGMGLAKDLPVAVIGRPMAFNQDVKALVSRGDFSGQYLRSAIYAGKQRLLSRIVPSAHGTMTLNLDDIETFTVPCPSDPNEARDIVEALDAIQRKIELHRQKRRAFNDLFISLLHKLMTGEMRVSDLDLRALALKPLAEVNA